MQRLQLHSIYDVKLQTIIKANLIWCIIEYIVSKFWFDIVLKMLIEILQSFNANMYFHPMPYK